MVNVELAICITSFVLFVYIIEELEMTRGCSAIRLKNGKATNTNIVANAKNTTAVVMDGFSSILNHLVLLSMLL